MLIFPGWGLLAPIHPEMKFVLHSVSCFLQALPLGEFFPDQSQQSHQCWGLSTCPFLLEATDIRKAGLSRRGKIRDSSERQVMDYTLARHLRGLILGKSTKAKSSRLSPAKSLQLCPTLCDPIDGSLPGSSVHRIFQTRVLEWVAIAFSAPMLGSQ